MEKSRLSWSFPGPWKSILKTYSGSFLGVPGVVWNQNFSIYIDRSNTNTAVCIFSRNSVKRTLPCCRELALILLPSGPTRQIEMYFTLFFTKLESSSRHRCFHSKHVCWWEQPHLKHVLKKAYNQILTLHSITIPNSNHGQFAI